MVDRQIFEEMLTIYDEAIIEMGELGEWDWFQAANETSGRLGAYLRGELKETPLQLARECHADLQGYVQVRYDSDLMDVEDCSSEGCFDLYLLSQRLIQIAGLP